MMHLQKQVFFTATLVTLWVLRMLWPVPLGSPAKMLVGCFENLEFCMVGEERLEVVKRYHGLKRLEKVEACPIEIL